MFVGCHEPQKHYIKNKKTGIVSEVSVCWKDGTLTMFYPIGLYSNKVTDNSYECYYRPIEVEK